MSWISTLRLYQQIWKCDISFKTSASSHSVFSEVIIQLSASPSSPVQFMLAQILKPDNSNRVLGCNGEEQFVSQLLFSFPSAVPSHNIFFFGCLIVPSTIFLFCPFAWLCFVLSLKVLVFECVFFRRLIYPSCHQNVTAFSWEVLLGTFTDLARYNCQRLYFYKFYLTTCIWPLTFELRTLFWEAENPKFESVSIRLVYPYVRQPVSCHFHSALLNKCSIHNSHFFSKLPFLKHQNMFLKC